MQLQLSPDYQLLQLACSTIIMQLELNWLYLHDRASRALNLVSVLWQVWARFTARFTARFLNFVLSCRSDLVFKFCILSYSSDSDPYFLVANTEFNQQSLNGFTKIKLIWLRNMKLSMHYSTLLWIKPPLKPSSRLL